ncbi:MAG: sigma-54-dependent Fis family transcriptional regulator [Phycisphaerales bacterium]|nr:sigma-54-dependent Fis family transcriptional regulator [Phycisphaerales bacterium]
MPGGPRQRVLIVDDDPIVAESLAEFLGREGFEASTALNVDEARDALREARDGTPEQAARPFAVVITDVSLPGPSGLDLLRYVGERHPETAVVMLTGYGHVEGAVESLRLGAVDYLTKPVLDAELRLGLERALRQQALRAENCRLRHQLDERYSLDNIIGGDPRMLRLYDLVEAVAPTKTTVLMSGESGTGKSLIAHAIHHRSTRRDQPFVELSCGSIPETLLESELFGHVKGAFTGAHADKPGRFLAAHGGTIFLDEINSASPAMQLKLLRVLQERRFEPVGSNKTIEVDVRVILASNQPLERMVAEGKFRQDLFYRINVVMIELPPLRERVSDIPLLAEHFLERYAAELGKQVVGFSLEAMQALRRYPFPGNIRELENVVQRAAVLTKGQTIQLTDLPGQVSGQSESGVLARMTAGARAADEDSEEGPWMPETLESALRGPERSIILRALRANEWNRQKTADDLGINRTTLYKKMRALGIHAEDDARQAG